MASRIGTGCSFIVALSLVGCASSAEARPTPKAPASEALALASTQPQAVTSPLSNATTSPGSDSPAQEPPPNPSPDPKTGEVPRGLPELKLQLSGLHIGGGPNDAETKRPFIETLERGFDTMRACYAQVEQPEKGGTFGVDLRVERAGGHPTLQAVRTIMKGDGFRSCVEEAFRALEFVRPAKGPTVLSASLRFTLEP